MVGKPRSRRERNLARDVNDPKRIKREKAKREELKRRRKGNGKPEKP